MAGRENDNIYRKFIPKVLKKKFPEILLVTIYTYSAKYSFSPVYVIEIYVKPEFKVGNCQSYINQIGKEIETFVLYFGKSDPNRVDIRIRDVNYDTICKGEYYNPSIR